MSVSRTPSDEVVAIAFGWFDTCPYSQKAKRLLEDTVGSRIAFDHLVFSELPGSVEEVWTLPAMRDFAHLRVSGAHKTVPAVFASRALLRALGASHLMLKKPCGIVLGNSMCFLGGCSELESVVEEWSGRASAPEVKRVTWGENTSYKAEVDSKDTHVHVTPLLEAATILSASSSSSRDY